MKTKFPLLASLCLLITLLPASHVVRADDDEPEGDGETTLQTSVKAEKKDVQIGFDEIGLSSIVYDGNVLLAPENGRPGVGSQTGRSFDLATHTATFEAEWGRATIRYEVLPDRLIAHISVTPNGKTENIASITPFFLRAPQHTLNTGGGSSMGGQIIHETGTVGIFAQPATLFTEVAMHISDGKGGHAVRMILPRDKISKHPVVDNSWFSQKGFPIEAGQTSQWKITLAFGPPSATNEQLYPAYFQNFSATHPVELKWPDRRLIGTIFFAQPTTGWETNPRGYNFGRKAKQDVTTEEGLKQFGEDLMAYADKCLKNLKAKNAQGVIIWNLEGEQFPHAISYIAQPQLLGEIAPEMDRFADAFFKKFTDAGLKVGITIRPTEVYATGKEWPAYTHRDVFDPVKLMDEKIRYAKKRWGCTIFYIDSNVFGNAFGTKLPKDHNVPWIMPAEMIEKLHEMHPDCLIIPEWSNSQYLRFSAPYASQNLGQTGIPPQIRRRYPGSFKVIMVNKKLIEKNWETYVGNVEGGDILLFPCWYGAPENALIDLIYREANYLRETVPETLKTASSAQLADKIKGADEKTRFQIAGLLGEKTDATALQTVATLLDDESVIIQKAALSAIAAQKRVADPKITEQLVASLASDESQDLMLQSFTAKALGAVGEAAVPPLLKLVESEDRNVWTNSIRALGLTGTTNPKVHAALVKVLDDPAKKGLRETTTVAIAQLKVKDAVPSLLALLKTEEPETLRLAAIGALGVLGDKSAVSPLIEAWKLPYRTTALYGAPGILDGALANLTGERWITQRDQWERWWKRTGAAIYSAPPA